MQFFALWLKSEKYSVVKINNYPTIIEAVNVIFMWSSGFAANKLGSRAPVTFVVGCCLTFVYIVLTIWNVPSGLLMFVFCFSGCYGCFSPLLYGWVNSSCGGDQQLRAFTLAWMTSVGLWVSQLIGTLRMSELIVIRGVVAPYQLYMFPSSEAPTYSKTHGYGASLAFVVALTLWVSFGIPYVQRRVAKRGRERVEPNWEVPTVIADTEPTLYSTMDKK